MDSPYYFYLVPRLLSGQASPGLLSGISQGALDGNATPVARPVISAVPYQAGSVSDEVYRTNWGRFHQADTIGHASRKNLYAYIGNDPLNRIDPSGLNDQPLSTRGNESLDGAAPGALVATLPDIRQAWMLSPTEMLGEGCLVASTWPIGCGGGGGGSGGGRRAAVSATEGQAAAAAGSTAGAAAAAAEKAPTAYSVFFETTIGKLGIGTRASHFAQANRALSAAMERDAEFAAAMREAGIEVPTDVSRSPANFSWHHVPDRPGTMQLVPRAEHQGGPWQSLFHPGGVGGFKVWGSDY
jgi:hypothetical protein